MIYWYLLIILVSLVFIIWPLKKNLFSEKILLLICISMLAVISWFGYQWWGNYEALKVNAMLQNKLTYTPAEMVTTLEASLNKQPTNYRAWYVLGEGWMQAGNFHRASDAFKKVVIMTNDDPDALAKYAQALFMVNDRQPTLHIEKLVNKVLVINSDNRTALGLSGIIAFTQHRYNDAIEVWNKLLNLTEKSEAKELIISGIRKAESLLKTEKN